VHLAIGSDGLPGAVRAGELVFVGGCAGREPAEALGRLSERLAVAGASVADVVGILSFHTDVRRIDAALDTARHVLGSGTPPAWTPTAVVGLEHPGATVELSAIARAGDARKRAVTPDTIAWWRNALPMAAGCRRGDLTVISGQFGTDADGYVNTPGDHAGQARNALNRVKEIGGLLGAGLDEVIELLAFHQDPRGIALGRQIAETETFPGALPTWVPAGVPALYGFGMLGQYQAIACPSLVAVSAEAESADAAWTLATERLRAADAALSDVVSIASLQKDVRDIAGARELVAGDCAAAWTAAAVTGFAGLDSHHTFRVLAIRRQPA
jgi:enamine deaminase RidA (YjgF/YER057c/UK114 family)